MKALKDYVKSNEDKLDAAVTSVTLERRHVEFIRRLNLNLSKIVRDLIDDLMKGADNEDKKE